MLWGIIFGWWLIGSLTMFYDVVNEKYKLDQELLWVDLLFIVFTGICGLIIPITLVTFWISKADFWNKPVFKKKTPPIENDYM